MAKEKKEEQPSYLKDIIKQYGNVVVTGNKILEQKKAYKTVTISPAIDLALNGGIREGSWLVLSGAPKCGKAQPYSATVYTPSGPKFMADMMVGMDVCVPSGEVAKIIGVFPQGTIPVYKITFSDGTSTRASGDHLWQVTKNIPWAEPEIRTTEQLEVDLQLQDRNKWAIKTGIATFDFRNKENEISPRVMGLLLADGALSGREIKITTKNIPDHIHSELEDVGIFVSTYNSLQTINQGEENKVKEALKRYGLDVVRKDKFIPDDYKYNGTYIRISLLKTMMECNGHYNKTGYIEYTTCSKRLANDMAEVARSLGIITKVKPRGNSFRVTFHGQNLDLIADIDRKNIKRTHKTILSIVPDGHEKCQCIKIDHPSELYLTDDFIVTHNTTTAMQLAYNCQQEGRPVIYINSEGRLNDLNFEVEGLDPEKMTIITAEDKPLSAEAFLDITNKLISIKENEGALCIVDSVSSLIPSKELDEDVTGSMRPGLPKILSNFTKKAGQIVPNNKIIMCMITHIISNTGGYGPSKMADSGVKIQYQSDTRMEVTSIAPWEQSDKKMGQAVNWKVYYSGLGAKAYECQSWIKYGHGIDKIQELSLIGQEAGLIGKAGAWFTCDFLISDLNLIKEIFPDVDTMDIEAVTKACKFQGGEKLYNFLSSDERIYNLLHKEIKGMLL